MKLAPGRIPELDGLRGLAILLVISFHYLNNQLVNSQNGLAKALAFVTSFGWLGVDLFFVLSGFLICTILLKYRDSKNYFSTFYIRRLVRIVPNYYLLMLVFYVVTSLSYFSQNYFLSGNRVIPDWSYLLMIHNFYMADVNNMGNDAMSVTWSVGIEEQFYIIFPFIIYTVQNKVMPFVFVIIMGIAIVSRIIVSDWIPAYVLLNCRADALATGGLIAWLNLNYNLSDWYARNIRIITSLVFGTVVLMVFCFVKYRDLGPGKNLMFSIIFGYMVICALVKRRNVYVKFLRLPILMWIGTISYSLYLFHYLILGLTHHLFGNENGIGINSGRDVLISSLALFISFLFAWLVYRYLENPVVKLGKLVKY